jgi:hypothetical protein
MSRDKMMLTRLGEHNVNGIVCSTNDMPHAIKSTAKDI